MKTKNFFKFKVIIIICVIYFFLCNLCFSQNVLDGVYIKERDQNREPIPYTHLREADVMWSKRIWRIIDLREKINLPLYFPTERIGERMSLMEVFMDGITNEGLTAYSADADDRFTIVLTKEQIEEKSGVKEDTVWSINPDTQEEEMKIMKREFQPTEIKQYIIKEDWFFDKQKSVMEVRIIGISPIRWYIKDGTEEIRRDQMFWIYFPEARPILAKREVFNPYNDAERRTFDDIFWKRIFSSIIIKESNAYEDRSISSYRIGLAALLEAELIKENIFQIEHDLWEY